MKCFNQLFLLMAWTCLGGGASTAKKRQVGSAVVEDDHHEGSETGFGSAEAHHGGGKYFQYIHVPAKDHYDHGHRRGNDHHFIERHEKAHPHAGEFKTKVRWGDKHGGYGEHYWDYNHAGHDHDGDASQHQEEYAHHYDEEESRPVPSDQVEIPRGKRERDPSSTDVEFISPAARSAILQEGKAHGGNYRLLH